MRFQALVKALKNESLHIFLCNNNHNYILTIQRLTPWAVPFWDTIIVARSSSDDRFVSLRPVCHERGGGGVATSVDITDWVAKPQGRGGAGEPPGPRWVAGYMGAMWRLLWTRRRRRRWVHEVFL